jgi:hypothetical protein
MILLAADDNLASRELMREVLEASGHCVVEVKLLTSSIEIRPMLCSWICKCPFSTVLCGPPTTKPIVSGAWPIWGTVQSALAHLRYSPHANRFAFPCDCNELPGERWFFRVGAVRASPLNRSQSRCHGP